MRGSLLAVTVVLACWISLAAPAAAQQAESPLADLVLAGAPLVAPVEMPPAGGQVTAAAASAPQPTLPPTNQPPGDSDPLAPELPAAPAAQVAGTAGLQDLFASLDPRDWASAVLDTVVETLAGSLLETIRDFVDWALGLGDSPMNFITRTPAEGTYESTTVRGLWELSRALANGGLALIVMWGGLNVALKEHTRSPYDGVMALLPRVALAALALNLTLEFARVLIDLNNAFTAAVGEVGLPGYEEAGAGQSGLGLVIASLAYAVVALLLAFQMLMRLALIAVLIVLAPLMVLLWVLPQTQGWTRWWAHLFPLTVFQQAVQVVVLRLGSALMVELTPGSVGSALLTLLLGIAVCWLTLKVPSLLRGQVHHAGMSAVVSLVVLGRAAGALAPRAGGAAAAAGAGGR